ncbi:MULTISPECIES: sensor histidine kinase [Paenibacillus]|uniref:histidine kinase n=1 Tax=Paenibacillus lactis TaxID=228574 RepID=A0ABS4FG69_9BACL|nr:histidine kinase [Paenibacillus lactis]MBP1895257.1 signal transduction histidine kinase [Paenibacillus lactis]HAF97736.1 sensor histidine kinase [Paenibacillus lactis]
MRSFWIWLLLLIASWLLALWHLSLGDLDVLSWRIGSSAVFLAAFFIAPLFRNRPAMLFVTLLTASVFAVVSLWPASEGSPNIYSLLVFSILAGKAAYRVSPAQSIGIGIVLLIGAMLPKLMGYPGLPLPFLLLYAILLALGLGIFRMQRARYEETLARNEALLSEYRNMKRRLVTDEQLARREERAQVGRDIHDSVGHKLTALLMQLEMQRLQADHDTANVLQGLKVLAKESLEETRNAVKSLKQQETGGLAGIMGLLRRLEAERFMRVHLTARHGALTTPLSNSQSIAVYRAVQEAMTNAMKHGSTREVSILFEAPGGGMFRFEVSNPYQGFRSSFREGYGLQSMRERLESEGGSLEVVHYDNVFVVRGELLLNRETKEGVN